MKPILFNTEMVRAILDGRKTQTRRIIKPQPTNPRWNNVGWLGWDDGHGYRMRPPCELGDILWVRETWNHVKFGLGDWHYEYRADYDDPSKWSNRSFAQWRPSIHMPREAARIFLRVTDVRVERLQEITKEQARAEGCDGRCDCPSSGTDGSLCCVERDFSLEKFESVWDSTIKRSDLPLYGWYANPWVWVIEFERCDKP